VKCVNKYYILNWNFTCMSLSYMSLFLYVGLDVCEQFMDVSDMIRDEDLILHKVNSLGNGIDQRVYTTPSMHNIQQLVANMVPSVISKRPSARQLNLLKRKAKINSKDQTKCWSEDGDTEMLHGQNTATLKGQCTDSLSCDKVLGCLSICDSNRLILPHLNFFVLYSSFISFISSYY
jgi:hypothetical protein